MEWCRFGLSYRAGGGEFFGDDESRLSRQVFQSWSRDLQDIQCVKKIFI